MAYGFVTADGGFTIECWFLRTAVVPASLFAPFWGQYSQSKGQSFFPRQALLGTDNNGAMTFFLVNNAGTQLIGWADPAPTGYASDSTWHHVVVRLAADKVTITIFLDGAQLVQLVAPSAWDITAGVMVVGAEAAIHRGVYVWVYDSRMSYFAAYDRALTANRIFEHYTAGNGGTVYYGDDEATRVERILNWADVPIPSRLIDSSVTILQGIAVAGSNALDKLHETVEASLGLLFADGQTRVVYRNRRHAYNRFSSVTLGESLQSAPEVEFEFSTDKTWIFNDIRGTRPFGGTIRIQNILSRAKYGRKVYSFTIPITDSVELRNAVTWLLGRYGTARPRVSAVRFSAIGSELIEFASSGGLQVGDVFTVTDLDVGEAPDTTMKFNVEGMSLDADFKNETWTMTFNLSPYDLNKVFQIGVSELGDGSLIAF